MDETSLAHYRAQLTDLKTALEADLDESADSTAPVQLDGTMGRVSRGDALQAQQLALEARRQREERLQRVQNALLRIEQGTYGRCPRCQNPIAPARLDAFPEAVTCVRCSA